MQNSNKYDANLDRKFLEAMDVRIVQHQPWQFSLFHPDLEGKFVWYPHKGTLMYESDDGVGKVGEYFDSEDVYNVMMRRIIDQQNGTR